MTSWLLRGGSRTVCVWKKPPDLRAMTTPRTDSTRVRTEDEERAQFFIPEKFWIQSTNELPDLLVNIDSQQHRHIPVRGLAILCARHEQPPAENKLYTTTTNNKARCLWVTTNLRYLYHLSRDNC